MLHYFVHHESRSTWGQSSSDLPRADDGLVGECERAVFQAYVKQGYEDVTGLRDEEILSRFQPTPPTEDIDPWT